MSKSYYSIAEEWVNVEEGGHIGYGIKCSGNGNNLVLSDISPCRGSVEALAEKLNKMDAESVHFRDIVEDFLP